MHEQEGVLTIKIGKELKAVVYNDISRRAQIFYKVTEMGSEDIKYLLDEMGTITRGLNGVTKVD